MAVSGLVRPASAQNDDPANNYAQVRVISERAAFAPGEPIRLALVQDLTPKWHTYWINPGDAGEPTRIALNLPEGWTMSGFDWPVPEMIDLEGIVINYGYEDQVILPFTVTPPADAPVGERVTLAGEASWLICLDVCIPEAAPVEITLPVRNSMGGAGRESHLFAKADESLPRVADDLSAGAVLTQTDDGNVLDISVSGQAFIDLFGQGAITDAYFFAEREGNTKNMLVQPVDAGPQGLTYRVDPGFRTRNGLEEPISGVATLTVDLADGPKRFAYQVTAMPGVIADGTSGMTLISVDDVPTSDLDEAFSEGEGASEGGDSPARAGTPSGVTSIWTAVAFAFLGGLILNLMPCVFPVLSLKAMSFVSKAHKEAGVIRVQGLVFLAGVMVTFAALGGLLMVLQTQIEGLGWGFQMQNPYVVAGMTVLIFLIGLNMLGLFEIGTSLQGLGGSLADRGGYSGSFFTGVLAVAVAAPCTAPFMAGALGFALTAPPALGMAVFLALGLGLAFPFVLLALFPRLLRYLPRPGAWMETLRKVFAFAMFLTAAWLVWVFGSQTSGLSQLVLLGGLAFIAFGLWALKESGSGRSTFANIAKAAGGMFLLAGLVGPFANVTPAKALNVAVPSGSYYVEAADGVLEGNWSPLAVPGILNEGKAVLVDFTATWCLSCQFNKRNALSRRSVREAMAANDVVFLTADWTNRDSVIGQELARHGRPGVPLYLYYPKGEAEPQILPQLLTPRIVLDAIAPDRG